MTEGLDLYSYQEAITAHVKTLYPDYDVIEDTLEDDLVLTRDINGKMPAYIILRYGPMLPARRGKSFAGPRHDEYYATVDMMAIANKGNIARKLNAAMTNDMIGFKPDGTAPMTIQDDGGMFAAFVVSSNEARPTRSLASTRMRFKVNTNNIGYNPRP
jgi:hypothetical protein